MAPLLTFIPVALALTLIALAHDGGVLTRTRLAQVAAVAMLAGPVAIELVGFVAWLGLVALTAPAPLLVAASRRSAARRASSDGRVALVRAAWPQQR